MKTTKTKQKTLNCALLALILIVFCNTLTLTALAADSGPPGIDEGAIIFDEDDDDDGVPTLVAAPPADDPDPDPGPPPDTTGSTGTVVVATAQETTATVAGASTALPTTGPGLIIPAIIAAGVAIGRRFKK